MKRNKRDIWLRVEIAFAGLCVITATTLFQNCSGFSSKSLTRVDAASAIPTEEIEEIEDVGTRSVYKVTMGEMVPVELQLPADVPASAVDPQQLPPGALLDTGSKMIRWLPKKGQAGLYEITLKSVAGQPIIRFEVQPIPEDTLKISPYDIYRDGDVGYVFVHGAGELDRCLDRVDLSAYWGASVDIIAPNAQNRTVVCYDGRKSVAEVGPQVANQILAGACGRFNKCVIITHSMGGLLMEHMFTHTRAATANDTEPFMFANAELYKKVQDRTLFAISLGSAAGGSKVANIVENPLKYDVSQAMVSYISPIIGRSANDATRNLKVVYASRVVAPITENPGVPFFMVPGYSPQLVSEQSGVIIGLIEQLVGTVEADSIFNADLSLAFMDRVANYHSRSDGLVDFRSSCGIASDDENAGPGYFGDLEQQFRYCVQTAKKPNHYIWFATNLNHFLMTVPTEKCQNANNPCHTLVPDRTRTTFAHVTDWDRLSVAHVIRNRVAGNIGNFNYAPLPVGFNKALGVQQRGLAAE